MAGKMDPESDIRQSSPGSGGREALALLTTAASRDGSQAGAVLPDLVALRAAVSNGALKGDRLPARIKILNWGENPSTKGPVIVGERSVEKLAANQRRLGFERVAVDYNHCSVPDSPEHKELLAKGQPPIIFGYGRPNVIRGEGMFLEEMQWTPLGVERAASFEDLSPAANFESGEVEFVHSVALTTNGCLHDVTFFSAANIQHPTSNIQHPTTNNQHPIANGFMSDTTNQPAQGVITLAVLASALGLAATAAEAEVVAKVKRLSALEPLEGLIKDGKVLVLDMISGLDGRLMAVEAAGSKGLALLSATVDGKTVTLTSADMVGLVSRVAKLETALSEQSSAATDAERGRIISLFSAEGKAPNGSDGKPMSVEALKQLDLSSLRLLYANTPSTVPLSARSRLAMEGSGLDSKLKGRERFIAAQERDLAGRR